MKNFNQFILEKSMEDIENIEFFNKYDILESIVTDTESILKTINAEECSLFYTFGVSPEKYSGSFNIEDIYEEVKKNIQQKGWSISELEKTIDLETFLEKTFDVKYFFVYKKNKHELENPDYIIMQSKDKKKSFWNNPKCYLVKGDINNFYNKLTCKTIEISRDDKKYIYLTSNSGNDWKLQNINDKNIEFKEFLTNEEITKILKDKNTTITIIS